MLSLSPTVLKNPILDTTSVPGRAIVTKSVFQNPVYLVFADLVARKQMLALNQSPEQLAAPYTLTVKDAAESSFGLTESAVRTGCIHHWRGSCRVSNATGSGTSARNRSPVTR